MPVIRRPRRTIRRAIFRRSRPKPGPPGTRRRHGRLAAIGADVIQQRLGAGGGSCERAARSASVVQNWRRFHLDFRDDRGRERAGLRLRVLQPSGVALGSARWWLFRALIIIIHMRKRSVSCTQIGHEGSARCIDRARPLAPPDGVDSRGTMPGHSQSFSWPITHGDGSFIVVTRPISGELAVWSELGSHGPHGGAGALARPGRPRSGLPQFGRKFGRRCVR